MIKLSRRQSLKALLVAAPAAAVANAFLIEPNRLSITRREITLPNLDPSLDGLTIAQITDLHFKPGTDDALMQKLVATVNQENVDIIALTGDYVTDDPSVLPPLIEHLKQLQATHSITAVLGNHDGWSSSRAFYRKHFEAANINLLINQNTQLHIKGSPLYLAGSDYVWFGTPNASETLKNIPSNAPFVALVHEPDYFDNMRAVRNIGLQLSGHTHGGQCRVPFLGYAPVTVEYGKNYIYGDYQVDASQLFVSRGTGTSGLRVRFACPPELVIFTLRSPA
ncbi:metallophosphoesterase [Rubritalea tangerina]|uniref:Metallophosphoesterase n=2 Tax=Rubritalea tangerina TaxID=430798 RepID=A0ABW4ZCG7_9BACT